MGLADHLPWVHPIVRVERPLDRAHDVERRTMLRLEILHLAGADAVLAAARPPHCQRAKHHPLVQPAGFLDLRGARWVEHVHQVKVAVARVADEADRKRRAGVVLPAVDDALGETGNRDADVGGPRTGAGTQRDGRVERIVPRLPQPLAILEPRRPLEAAAAPLRRQRLHGVHLVRHVTFAVAVEFEEQRRRDGVGRLRIAVDGVDLGFIEQLDARDRHAELNRGDDRFDRALNRIEPADGGRHRLGERMQPERDLGDDAERAFRADEEARQVEPADDLRARVPVLITVPSARTRVRPRTFSRIVPYRSAVVPEARVAAMPPIVASAPGSIGNMRPVFFSALCSCSRVTPASTVASRSSTPTRTIRFMPRRSIVMPPWIALTWPSSDVPAPNGTTGR